jgi:hypothetical protein
MGLRLLEGPPASHLQWRAVTQWQRNTTERRPRTSDQRPRPPWRWVEPFHEVLSNLFGRSDQRAVPKPMLDLSTDWKLVSASFAGSS